MIKVYFGPQNKAKIDESTPVFSEIKDLMLFLNENNEVMIDCISLKYMFKNKKDFDTFLKYIKKWNLTLQIRFRNEQLYIKINPDIINLYEVGEKLPKSVKNNFVKYYLDGKDIPYILNNYSVNHQTLYRNILPRKLKKELKIWETQNDDS